MLLSGLLPFGHGSVVPVLVLVLLGACGGGATDQAQSAHPGDDAGASVDATSCTTDTKSDVNNCGACGHVCPHLPGTTATCLADACAYACLPAFADCDQDLTAPHSNGCEAMLKRDPRNCGRCGVVCPDASTTNHSAPSCRDLGNGPTCGYGCAPGWADCNFAPSDGCEVDLTTNGTSCGECTNHCPSQACSGATCAGEAPFCSLFAAEIVRAIGVAVASDGTRFALAWNEFTDGALHIGPR